MPQPEAPRLNIFVGVPETTFRFWLLVAGCLAVALSAWDYLTYRLDADVGRAVLDCLELPAAPPLSDGPDPLRACMAERVARPNALYMLFGVGLAAAATLALAAVVPGISAWRRRWTSGDSPLLDGTRIEVDRIGDHLGVAVPPIWLSPSPHVGGRVSGGPFQRSRLVLRLGLVQARTRSPATFAAVVAHELAHVRNRDVGVAHMAAAAWAALILVAFLPFVVGSATSGYLNWQQLLLVAVLVLSLRLVLHAVLRSREREADVRALDVAGIGAALTDLFTTGPRWSRLRASTSQHPEPHERLRVIRHPESLLAWSGLDLALLAGTAVLSLPATRRLWSQAFYGIAEMTFGFGVSALIAGSLAGAGLWALAWRDGVHRQATGDRRRRAGAVGAVSLGVVLGFALAPGAGAAYWSSPFDAMVETVVAALVAMWCGVLTAFIALPWAHDWAARAHDERTRGTLFWSGLGLCAAGTVGVLDLVGRIQYFVPSEPSFFVVLLVFALGGLLAEPYVAAYAAVAVVLVIAWALSRRLPRLAPGRPAPWMLVDQAPLERQA